MDAEKVGWSSFYRIRFDVNLLVSSMMNVSVKKRYRTAKRQYLLVE